MARRQDNHMDDPEKYEPWQCAVCRRCWRHVQTGRCPYGGPFEGVGWPRPAEAVRDG